MNNFWVYSTHQTKLLRKIILRKLQDTHTVYVRHVGVPFWGTNVAANKVSKRNEAANEFKFIVSLHTYDDIFTVLQ